MVLMLLGELTRLLLYLSGGSDELPRKEIVASWCNRTWQKQNPGAGGLVIGQGSVHLCRRAKRHPWQWVLVVVGNKHAYIKVTV